MIDALAWGKPCAVVSTQLVMLLSAVLVIVFQGYYLLREGLAGQPPGPRTLKPLLLLTEPAPEQDLASNLA
jgi:hypothetical protein